MQSSFYDSRRKEKLPLGQFAGIVDFSVTAPRLSLKPAVANIGKRDLFACMIA